MLQATATPMTKDNVIEKFYRYTESMSWSPRAKAIVAFFLKPMPPSLRADALLSCADEKFILCRSPRGGNDEAARTTSFAIILVAARCSERSAGSAICTQCKGGHISLAQPASNRSISSRRSTDVLARIAAEKVSPGLGQQIIVESRSGAGGNIAGEFAARSEPDGYTLLVAGQAILAINKALYKKLSYDPATDFAFIAMLGVIANVLLVNPKTLPVNSLAELIALAKKKPGEISYASNGPGSLTHLTTAIMAHQAGVELLHVPYRGAAPLMTDLLAGRIGMTFTAASLHFRWLNRANARACSDNRQTQPL